MAKATQNLGPAKKRTARRKALTGVTSYVAKPKDVVAKRSVKSSPRTGSAAAAMRQAKDAGLLEGERTEHVSFRAPRALVEAAKREAGVTSTTELGLAALALAAQPDPVAQFFKASFGALGPDFDLDY